MSKMCKEPNCDRPFLARGFCKLHYERYKYQGLIKTPDYYIRFWGRVKACTYNECWEWTGRVIRGGYGHFDYKKKSILAHRMSWFLTYGKWPSLCVLHKCDNRLCVNPEHLFLGSYKDNSEDAVKKGRQAKGSKINKSKLTEQQVKYIKQKLKIGIRPTTIAKEFNVHPSTIMAINHNKTWTHIKI